MNALSIFPNPSDSGRFNISARNEVISIEVYNVLGKLLKQLTDLSNTEFTLDLSAFDDGLYLIKVIDLNNNSVVKRLIRK